MWKIWILIGIIAPFTLSQKNDFTCPEDFGYYPHPSDCSQYYVCVFGGALLESCTGGLMYSTELQTCDWPRNVNQIYCNGTLPPTTALLDNSVRLSPQQPINPRARSTTPTPQPPSYYKPIKIENYGDLTSVINTRVSNEAEEGQRSGRSYAQSGPEIRKEFGKNVQLTGRKRKKTRYKRQILLSFLDKIGLLKKKKPEARSFVPKYSMYPANHYYKETSKNPVQINFRSRPNGHHSHVNLNFGNNYKITTTTRPKFSAKFSSNVPIVLKRPNLQAFTTTTKTTTTTTTKKPSQNNTYDYYDDYYDDEQDTKKGGFTFLDIKPKSVGTNPNPSKYDYQEYAPYANQRYAANIPTNVSQVEDDEESYYVYEDEKESPDVDYYPPQIQTTTTTRRPKTTQTTTQKTRSRTRSSSSSSSSTSKSRPTLRPKSQIVKEAQPVRDVYIDAPTRSAPVYQTPVPNTPATKCKRDVCLLPDCNCGGKEIPAGLRPEETPQMVLLTFDDSVNELNKNLYRDLFEKGRKNPNGCPISATFYVSHEWTDYSQVQNLAADGHEMASHSVSHSFGESFSQKKWEMEINGQREILAAYGGVKLSEVRGMRAPFLAIGGNNMFKMLHDVNFTYDSSMPVYENRPPSWPYTLDYKIFHDCMIPPCPTKSYPGVWEVPMVMWQDLKGGRCSMGDACSTPPTAEGVYQMLAKNFERHYTTNRAPFGLYYHAAWFTQAHHKEGFEAFLDTLVQMDDVWLVTNWQALQWMKEPTSNARINGFKPWSECRTQEHRPQRCSNPRVCNLWHKSGVRYMKTCQVCPESYPWTGQTGVPFTV